MAYTRATPFRLSGSTWAKVISGLVSITKPNSAEARHYEAHVARLADTSPHLLEDIGLSEADGNCSAPDALPIPSFGRHHF